MDDFTPHQLISKALDAMRRATAMLAGGEHYTILSGIEKATTLLQKVEPILSQITEGQVETKTETFIYTPTVFDIDSMLRPIPGDSPTGVNVRLSGEVNNLLSYVVNRTRATDFRPQYSELLVKAKQLLIERSKDLGVAVRLIEAAVEEFGFSAVADGLLLINGLFSNFWDGLYPESEDGDCEARANELTKLEELLLARLCAHYGQPHEFTPSCSDIVTAEKEVAVFKVIMEQFDILDKITAERFNDQSPDLSELRSMLIIFQSRIDAQCFAFRQRVQQEQEAARWEQEQAIVAAAEAVDRETERQTPSATDTAVISIEPKDIDDAAARIDKCVKFFIDKTPRNPLGYLINRSHKWFNTTSCNITGTLSEERRKKIIDSFTSQQWEDVLRESELAFMEGGHRWIDLQRYQVTAAEGLGGEYLAIAQLISATAIDFITNNRGILDESLGDGTPCASPDTVEWIRMGIANRGNLQQKAGFGGKPDSFFASEIERVNDLATKGRGSVGMGLLHSRLQQASCRREQFLWRIVFAEYCMKNGLTEIALAAIDHLVEIIEKINLVEWEDPELFVRVYKAGYAAYRNLGEKKAPAEKLAFFYRRICLYDPKYTVASE
jgi:type VI secretion system ImpA/VasJ family protein